MPGFLARLKSRAKIGMGILARPFLKENVAAHGRWTITCRRADGSIRWVEEFDNLIVNEGLNKMLTDTFKASGYTSAWYIGLKQAGSVAAGDTMSSHGGWLEHSGYSESVRQTFVAGTVASQSVSNAASLAEFTMNTTYTVTGAFLSTSNTKGGTSGTLFAAGDAATPRSGGASDVLQVSYTINTAAA